jgi:GAF domain-containing protein
MALPLIARGRTIGVLDVQSDKPGAFIETDASTLSILADQIAVAIENARLFDQTQRALSEMQALYSQNVMENWRSYTGEETLIGYQQSLAGGIKLNAAIDTDEIRQAMNRGSVLVFHTNGDQSEPQIVVPVKLRGQVIGVMKIKAPTKDRRWSQDEINLVEAVSERLSLALENARLLQDSQRQALKEQAIGEVTAKIGSSINLRNVLQTAVEELGRSIPGSEVIIRFEE